LLGKAKGHKSAAARELDEAEEDYIEEDQYMECEESDGEPVVAEVDEDAEDSENHDQGTAAKVHGKSGLAGKKAKPKAKKLQKEAPPRLAKSGKKQKRAAPPPPESADEDTDESEAPKPAKAKKAKDKAKGARKRGK
jgi:hypothetical protein